MWRRPEPVLDRETVDGIFARREARLRAYDALVERRRARLRRLSLGLLGR